MKTLWKPLSLSIILFLFSCTVKRIEMPTYEGVDVGEIIAGRSSIKSVEATFSIEFEKDDSTMTGDAVIELTDEVLSLRVYSLGFLAAEVIAENGVIKSNPRLDRNKSAILVDGLTNSFLWWTIKNYEIEEKDDMYQLRSSWRKLLIDKKTMLPRQQTIELDNGRELNVFYEEPANSGEFWYPSKMRIELSRYAVTLKIKTISFTPH